MADDLSLTDRAGLPDALRVLVEEYPRTGWQTHENFNGLLQFWLDRHLMFRRLLSAMQADAAQLGNREMGFEDYAPRLSRYGGMLINELHGHHMIEDRHYFPELVRLNARAERGFELLETDHQAMDGLLHDLAEAANAVLKGGEVGPFAGRLEVFGALLNRHLEDEEDIVVPVILRSGFQG